MLAANETVAQHFYWQELPFVYRVHDVPDPERIQKAVHVHQQLRVLHEGAGAQEQQGLHGGDPSQGDPEAVTED